MRIGKIVSSAEYRMYEQFWNCQFLESNFDFPNWIKSQNFLIPQFGKFRKIQILKICNLKNFQLWKFQKLAIRKIPKVSQIFKFRKVPSLKNTTIWKNIIIP